jgi:predicted TIM-barrel fold metal-dependent hydrolase
MFDCGIEGVEDLIHFENQFGYNSFNYLSCECMGDGAQNALGIYLKLKAPWNYAYGGLHYRYPYFFEEEAKKLIAIGFDGMKMVENKPTLRKVLKMATNDSRYDEFYTFLEKENIPMIVHIADPEEFWDKDDIPSWAVDCGYYYGDGTFVSKEQIYQEAFDVLERYPRLRITFAHFLFMSGDRERLCMLMERYPQMCLDLVSGTEMYFNFTKDPARWREFFLKYQDRIVFGTDNMNLYDPVEIKNARIVNYFEQEFIKSDHIIPAWDKVVIGIGLPPEVQSKIFRTNFQRLAGDQPKKINLNTAMEYLDGRLCDNKLGLTEREREINRYVYEYCKKASMRLANS